MQSPYLSACVDFVKSRVMIIICNYSQKAFQLIFGQLPTRRAYM